MALKRYFPPCMGTNDCSCFFEIGQLEVPVTNRSDYIYFGKEKLNHFLKLIKLHINKQEVNCEKPIQVKGITLRNSIYWMTTTKRNFYCDSLRHSQMSVILPEKTILLSDCLNYYDSLLKCWDLSMELFYYPESDVEFSFLKDLLEQHLQLLDFYEQFDDLMINGFNKPLYCKNFIFHHLKNIF